MKTKILDTNVILSYSIHDIIDSFGKEDIDLIIPFRVVKEIDTFKKGNDPVNVNARIAIRFLDELRSQGNLISGVQYRENILVRVHATPEDLTLDLSKVDNYIVMIAKELNQDGQVEIVTHDLHERILADVESIPSHDVGIDKAGSELYTGVANITITDDQVMEWFSNPNKGNVLMIQKDIADTLYPNQFVAMTDSTGTVHYGIFDYHSQRIFGLNKTYEAWGIKPKKDRLGRVVAEQAMLMHLLLDPGIEFVTIIGAAGSGKTLLTLACGLEQTLGKYPSLYEKIVIMRPLIGCDQDIGFLPGTKEEKLESWMGSSYDNLELLLGNYTPKDLSYTKDNFSPMANGRDRIFGLMDTGKLEFEALNFVRGRSMPKQFIIVDDAQNLTPQQAATIVTRAGEGTKLVMIGDVSGKQIDNHRLTPTSNGLAYTVDRFKGVDPIVGHITMKTTVRSHLAELGVKYL